MCHTWVSDHPIESLNEFIQWPDYKAIQETLCGSDSKATWDCYDGKYRRHKSLKMRNFCKEARVWLRLLNYSIMPLGHYSSVKKERVSIVYFFIKVLPINIGYWMMKEIRRMRECKAKRLSYGTTLTTFMMMLNRDLARPLDRVLEPLDSTTDISKVMAPGQSVKHNLTPAKERSSQSTLISQMHKIMVIQGEHFRLSIFLIKGVFTLVLHFPSL
ncbi:hypothetical protein RND71_023224 [Anisodus tanguticus]|uniref:Putative plant transposon protein domain-containing protein n=1 Tax=Anisodus tanguticus TaxID=243964 RepID=A0AAE1RS81_9SOLA|nr:hypothetical protein RND71_023224 [Anisodus tanguticus]